MWKAIILLLILITIAIVVTNNKSEKVAPPLSSPSPTQTTSKDTSKTQVIASNLEVPWALAFLPDNSILVTERKGTVRIIDKNGNLSEKPLATIPVKQTGESGLHGITIDPKYNDNHYVYLYYTYSSKDNNSLNRVSRFVFDSKSLEDETVIVDKIPASIFHDGGRIKFGPDGFLYITTGDAQEPSLSQNKNSLAGKILRVKSDGSDLKVYSLGHRNPQGIAFDDKNRLWEVEHGQSATDELNLIEEGKNYGWPTIRGIEEKDSLVTPILQSGSETWAPAGLAFLNGSLYFGGLRGTALFQYNIEAKEFKIYFKGEFGRIRDVVLGLDNMLYITTSNRDGRGVVNSGDDKIIKVDPTKL
ncbi:hypothetical protein A3C59_02380 [Candidatus Daviesbacteria bacterium RIFCSPHIGHO2_02_FULL_36_13]|uniref:Glucose/Sorbosone dehydrogenase domain-containing protein n=1 Tax=Candidatus Daviesbacteria bacterium RIFCSPHIGHO2_02_FULL_36_13 TaxID=1797768 RepID=A0A1F5JS63_9BACT|nr:MAG: hypothetical protein A3C59_02380 [Candidatus Daviesbacteria bacterium RIFCSPHIGHO2_02_FULL_36_13]OGE43147.1 MAG: hypothetical protein A3A45_00020 [Candidatus Daviesbacteria bacterium RIFCSPLOWO2_01_FULL_36_8]